MRPAYFPEREPDGAWTAKPVFTNRIPRTADFVLRDYYAGKLGDADLEERLLKDVDESHSRAICQTALEGLAAKKLNLDMLIERRAAHLRRHGLPRRSCPSSAKTVS